MQSRARVERLSLMVMLTLGFVALLATLPRVALAQAPGYQEVAINSSSPDASLVSESYVSLSAPLPVDVGPHPAACDRIGYLRYRAAGGPTNPADADAIFVAQPGILEGAGAFDQVARNTIIDAEQAGYHVEFWAINRRSNCLVDPTGIEAGIAAHNPQVAFNYYYGGSSINGQKFGGFVSEQSANWLQHVGLAQTVQDEYTVISQLPSSVRQHKVLCGGHSLGGIITGVFANWDFSGAGDPAQAGYHQCAGYFALETRFSLSSGMSALTGPESGLLNGVLGAVSNAAPYISVPPATPETEYDAAILGMASYWSPNARSALLAQFPSDSNTNATYDILLADSWLDLILGRPNARTVNATNQAVVGEVFSDDTQPFGFLRASLGAPTGGPLVEKNFPVPYDSPPSAGGLLGGQAQVSIAPSAATASGPLYSWLNYNQITGPMTLSANPAVPFATPTSEVSDVSQFSRTLFEAAPAMFTEFYFPTQLAEDSIIVGSGDRAGTLSNLRYSNGITQHPAVYVDGGQGLAPILDPTGSNIPSGPAPQYHVTAPGYNHLDVLTAARQQNNGQPELSSSTLAGWMEQVVGPPAG